MIDLHIQFGRNMEASVLFDGATAIRMRIHGVLDPSDPALDLLEVIEQFQTLREQALEFIGQMPSRLTVYRPPGLPTVVSERLEASAFAAGFDAFRTIGLGDIAEALFPASRGDALLLHASHDCLSGVALSRWRSDARAAVHEAAEQVDEAALHESLLSALRGLTTPLATRQDTVQKLIDSYWSSCAPIEFLDVREWGPRGWSAVNLSSADASAINGMTSRSLQRLLSELASGVEDAEIALIGEGRARLSALLATLMPNASIVSFPAVGLVDAMITLSRSDRYLSPERDAGPCSPEASLLFDPRTDLAADTAGLTRDSSAVRILLAPGKRIRLDHVPAKWHRAGFDIEVTLEGTPIRVRLFKEHVSMDLRTFSARIASRWSPNSRLFIRITIPELDTAVILVAQAGRETVAAHYRDKHIESVS